MVPDNGLQPQPGVVVDAPTAETLLDVAHLTTHIPVRGGLFGRTVGRVHAVDDVSFQIQRAETLGLVGESGCGKTTTGRSILRLQQATSGRVTFRGIDVFDLSPRAMKKLRAEMQIIFQDPSSALDPRIQIGDSIAEGLRAHGTLGRAERVRAVEEAMDVVGLRTELADRFPFELSGGQRQRVVIARALVLRPSLVVCDEPVSALDVSVQAQVLNLLRELQIEFGLTYLFIAHDLSVVQYFSDRVGVMYLGRLVELAPAKDVYSTPLHPYTKALLTAAPNPDPTIRRAKVQVKGEVPSPRDPPSGCRFRTRCPIAIDRCSQEVPQLRVHQGTHAVACHRVGETTMTQ